MSHDGVMSSSDCTVAGTQVERVLSHAETLLMSGTYDWEIWAVDSDGEYPDPATGKLIVIDGLLDTSL